MPVTLSNAVHQELEKWVNDHRTLQHVSQLCRIALDAANGQKDHDIAEAMTINGKDPAGLCCTVSISQIRKGRLQSFMRHFI